MATSRTYLLFFAFICAMKVSSSRHIQFYLNGYECFFQELKAGNTASIEYAPISGSKPHVDCTLEDPNKNVFYRQQFREYDLFRFLVNMTGIYRVCFSNIYDFSMYNNIIYLDWVTGDNDGKMASLKGTAQHTALTQLETSMVNIFDAMRIIELYQNQHRIREANSNLAAQSLNDKVLWWSVGQTMIFVTVGVVQVYILRRFFAMKKEEI